MFKTLECRVSTKLDYMRYKNEKKKKLFWQGFIRQETRHRALWLAVLVGTILTLINHGDVILTGSLPPIWKMTLTYMVPFFVSSYSSAAQFAKLSPGGFSDTSINI